MRIRSIQIITALALTATLSTGLSACSGNGNSNSAPSATEHSSESAANDSATNSMTSTAAAAVQDSFSATIDGQPFTIDQPIVACATEGDATSVNVTTTNSEGDYFTTVFGENGEVTLIMASQGDEMMLNFMDATGIGHAEVTTNGSTHTVKGEVPAANPADESAPLKPFEMTVTCP
jgi:lipoprotein